MNRVPDQEGKLYFAMWNNVFVTKKVPDMARIGLREPEKLIAGGIYCSLGNFTVSLKKKQME